MPGRDMAWVSATAKGLFEPEPSSATSPGPADIRVTTWVDQRLASRARPPRVPTLREATGLLRPAAHAPPVAVAFSTSAASTSSSGRDRPITPSPNHPETKPGKLTTPALAPQGTGSGYLNLRRPTRA